jgi:hypothetical protein
MDDHRMDVDELFGLVKNKQFIEKFLTLSDAKAIRDEFELSNGGLRSLMIVPMRYFEPTFDPLEAERIGRAYLEQRKLLYPYDTFEEITCSREFFCFVFSVRSPQWADRVPGYMQCRVDRADGHIWVREEYRTMGTIGE